MQKVLGLQLGTLNPAEQNQTYHGMPGQIALPGYTGLRALPAPPIAMPPTTGPTTGA